MARRTREHFVTKNEKTKGVFQALVGLAFAGSIGVTFIILACALPQYKLWWPFFVVIFYILAPLPTIVARRRITEGAGNDSFLDCAIFITMVIVVSSFGLPIVLARAPSIDPTIQWGACYLTLAGNVFVYLTMIIFFFTFDQEDLEYNMW